MASRIKERKKYGASLPKPPKCRGNKEPVWVKDEKKKKDPRDKDFDPGARNKKEPTGGGGKWVCKTKKKDPIDPRKRKDGPEVDGASYGRYGSSEPGKTISAKKFERKAKRNKKKTTATASSSTTPKGSTSSNQKTVVNKKNKRFVKNEMSMIDKDRRVGTTAVEYYKQKKGRHY